MNALKGTWAADMCKSSKAGTILLVGSSRNSDAGSFGPVQRNMPSLASDFIKRVTRNRILLRWRILVRVGDERQQDRSVTVNQDHGLHSKSAGSVLFETVQQTRVKSQDTTKAGEVAHRMTFHNQGLDDCTSMHVPTPAATRRVPTAT
jgi:hypothetical protein